LVPALDGMTLRRTNGRAAIPSRYRDEPMPGSSVWRALVGETIYAET
jgi:hypothetical protein